MTRIVDRLQTSARDIRVTRSQPPGCHLMALGVDARTFALNIRQRLHRCHVSFAAIDTTLRHIAPNILFQPIYQQNRIDVAPRLTLTVCPERQVRMSAQKIEINPERQVRMSAQKIEISPERQVRTLEQQIETRLLWRRGIGSAEPQAVDRIIRLAAACVERQRSSSPNERKDVPQVSKMHSYVAEVRRNTLNRPLDAIPDYRQPLSMECVVYRPNSATLTTANAPEVLVPGRPPVSSTGPAPNPSPTVPLFDSGYLRLLTDSVVDALDRRNIAAYERISRKPA